MAQGIGCATEFRLFSTEDDKEQETISAGVAAITSVFVEGKRNEKRRRTCTKPWTKR